MKQEQENFRLFLGREKKGAFQSFRRLFVFERGKHINFIAVNARPVFEALIYLLVFRHDLRIDVRQAKIGEAGRVRGVFGGQLHPEKRIPAASVFLVFPPRRFLGVGQHVPRGTIVRFEIKGACVLFDLFLLCCQQKAEVSIFDVVSLQRRG